jgi:hypothetical protein
MRDRLPVHDDRHAHREQLPAQQFAHDQLADRGPAGLGGLQDGRGIGGLLQRRMRGCARVQLHLPGAGVGHEQIEPLVAALAQRTLGLGPEALQIAGTQRGRCAQQVQRRDAGAQLGIQRRGHRAGALPGAGLDRLELALDQQPGADDAHAGDRQQGREDEHSKSGSEVHRAAAGLACRRHASGAS